MTNLAFPRKLVRWLAKVALLALVYHGAARVGLSLAFLQTNTSPVWPPTGIALAALVMLGVRHWPGVTLGVLLGSLATGAPPALALGMATGNTVEAAAGAYLLRSHLGFRPQLDRTRDVIALVVIAAAGAAASASVGASTLLLTQLADPTAFGPIWTTWWVGNLLGALVVTPFLFAWGQEASQPRASDRRMEAIAAFALLGLVTFYVFVVQASPSVYHQAVLYLIFPVAIWTAIRFGQRGGSTAVLAVSGLSIWATARGLGPFSLYTSNDNLILLQTFLGILALTTLLLASITSERVRATQALRRQAEDLSTLNVSSEAFLRAASRSDIYRTICDLAIARIGLDAAWITEPTTSAAGALPLAHAGMSLTAIQSVEGSRALKTPEVRDIEVRAVEIPHDETDGFQAPSPALAVVPLLFGQTVIGRLNLLSRSSDYFSTERRLLLMSYANVAAVVIQNRLLLEELQDSNRQLHGLSQRLMRAQEDERLHLSRELHDVSGQLLAGLLFKLTDLERGMGGLAEDSARNLLQLKSLAHDLQDNLHQLAVELRPASLDHVGLVTALEQYLAEFGDRYPLRVAFESVGMGGQRLPGEVEVAIYRVVQESLTNVVMHAKASAVDVLISRHNGNVAVTIEDNGVGFLPTSPKIEDHLGLFGMRERVEMLNGRFTVESAPGKGTTVQVEISCDD